MTSVGSVLRRKREDDGLPVEIVAARLCITPSYLRAIEADDVASLPGTFFYKSFALQYARVLGVDVEALRADLDSMCGVKHAEPESVETPAEPVASAPQRPGLMLHLASRTTNVARRGLGFGAGLALAICAGIGFAVWQVPVPESPVVTEAPAIPYEVPEPPEPAETVQPAPVEPDVATHEAVLNLAAREVTWLSITSGGKAIFEGILRPRQSKTLTGLDMAKLTVGNAGGLDVSWNGRPIGPIGKTGQVRVVMFSVDDVQVLPPGRSL